VSWGGRSLQGYPAQLLRGMLDLYSPSGSEAQLANFLRDEMHAKGMDASIDDAGNVIGVLGDGSPRILLCGHMDTISGNIPVRVDGDLLYGRGAVDAKSSLASMIIGAIQAKERTHAPVQITVAGVVEEETSSKGIRALVAKNLQYDLAVFGEPSGASNIVVGYKGSLKLHLSFRLILLELRNGTSASVSSRVLECQFFHVYRFTHAFSLGVRSGRT